MTDAAIAKFNAPGTPPFMAAELQRQLASAKNDVAQSHPDLSDLVFDKSGILWAKRVHAPDSSRWDAFDSSGTHLGYLVLPVSSQLLTGDKSRLLVASRDSLDRVYLEWLEHELTLRH